MHADEYILQLSHLSLTNKELLPEQSGIYYVLDETLLRETLVILAPYSFILGVESPRKEDLKLIEDSIYCKSDKMFGYTILTEISR